MGASSSVVRLWLVIAAIAGAIALTIARPLATSWSCLARAERAEPAEAIVVSEEEDVGLVVKIVSGSHAGGACTIHAYGGEEVGSSQPIIVYPDRPDTCDLVATVENSRALIVALTASFAAIGLGLLLFGLIIQRSLTQPAEPTTNFDDAQPPACPRCEKPMEAGYLVPMSGVHWRDDGQPVGLPTALGGLPGTVGWKGRPRLDAFRCEACEVATFRYGRPA